MWFRILSDISVALNFVFFSNCWSLIENSNNETRRALDLILVWQFWLMRNFLPSYKCDFILRSYLMGCKLFVRVLGQSFVIKKFATDVFTTNTSSIVVAVIKIVSVTRFQICSIVVSIYIRYWCFRNICNEEQVCSNSSRWRLPKILGYIGIICQQWPQGNESMWIILFSLILTI